MKVYSNPMFAVDYLKYNMKKKEFTQTSFSYVIRCQIGGKQWLSLALTDEKEDPTVYFRLLLNEDFSITAKMTNVDSKGKRPLWVTDVDEAYNSNQSLMVVSHFIDHEKPWDLLDNTNCDYYAFECIKHLVVEKFAEYFEGVSAKALTTRIDPLDKETVLTAWSQLPNAQNLSPLVHYALGELTAKTETEKSA